MSEKTEWEIVDADAAQASNASDANSANAAGWSEADGAAHRAAGGHAYARFGTSAGLPHAMRTLLGPWWRWKLAVAALLLVLFVILAATVAGAAVLVMTLVATVSFALAKLRQWLQRAKTCG
jgi:hypothetical protein